VTPSYLLRRLALAVLILLGSFSSGYAVTLLPQEQAIADDMINNPNQGRPTLILDPVIEAVARARAKDMAQRNYFSHVNPDGVAANYLLRQAGYVLPAWWGTDPAANYVESIAAGYSDPGSTWTAWMNSPDHKLHLLAQNSFFATETHYGVGYYYDPNSTYQYYWVVITAPPQPPPALAITAPDASAKVTSDNVPLAGTTDPSTNPASVQYRVENSAGDAAYQVAAGVSSWSGTAAGLAPGSNVIRVQSLDGSGNVIAEATRTIDYVVEGTLTVGASGNGAVTSAYLGTTSQPVGESFTVKAIPAAGYVFAGWTGSMTSGSAALAFTMQDGLNLQANFIPNPFPGVAASYYGILASGTGAQDGVLRFTISASGIFTGRVQLADGSWSFIGRLAADGSATVTIPRRGLSALTVSLQADLTGGSGQVAGTVSDGTDSYDFTLSASQYSARTNPAPQTGRYTLVLAADPSTTGSSAPQGNGYAAIVVSTNGSATVSGRLADGTPYSATGRVTRAGTLAIYTVPSGAPSGSRLFGSVTFRSTDVSDIDGAFVWKKGAKSRDPYYPAGFSAQLPSVGSLYVQPVAGLQPMDATPGTATAGLGDGNLTQPLAVPVTVTNSDKATMVTPGMPKLSLEINRTSGTVSGSFVMPNGSVSRGVRGVVFQKQNSAYGYFRGIDQCGYFSLNQGS